MDVFETVKLNNDFLNILLLLLLMLLLLLFFVKEKRGEKGP